MRNQGYVVLWKIFGKLFGKWFFGSEHDKDWPCSYVSHNGESRIT